MNLYERDYSKIIDEKDEEVQKLYDEYNEKNGFKNSSDNPVHGHPDFECRKFAWCYNSHFPNNCLFFGELERLDLKEESDKLREIICTSSNEREIQTYIKQGRKWFIPSSIFKDYNFGHHNAYIFPELRFGAELISDYALLGRSSDGFNLVLVEFEKANTPFMLQTANTESESVRKGITQIRNWKRWIDDNRSYFLKSIGCFDNNIDIPSSRIFYCLVVSKRDLMDDVSKELRSQIACEMQNTKIMSFDRLADNIMKLERGY